MLPSLPFVLPNAAPKSLREKKPGFEGPVYRNTEHRNTQCRIMFHDVEMGENTTYFRRAGNNFEGTKTLAPLDR